jgi:uroporphyrinogen-III decarboxylase
MEMTDMSSRERLMAAMRYQAVDHVPLVFHTFGFRPPAHLAWSDQFEEAQRWLSLGVDATLSADVPFALPSDVVVRSWEGQVPGQRWPLMVKEYQTSAGALRQEVYRTDDWSSAEWPGHREDDHEVRLLDDYNVPRSRRFLVESEADVAKLGGLLRPLSADAISRFKASAAAIGCRANELGVLVQSIASAGADMATWLCGVDGMLRLAIDEPEVFARLLEIIHARDKRNLEVLLDLPVDLVLRRAWYEGTAFWSPALFRKFFLPHLQELTTMVHQAGKMMGYIVSTGFMPLLDAYAQVGYDVHYYLDPVQGGPGTDLRKVKQVLGSKIAVLGGINSAVTLESGTPEEIRQAVFDAVHVLGPQGLILCPVDCIAYSTPWQSIETVIEAWKKVRDYPIK